MRVIKTLIASVGLFTGYALASDIATEVRAYEGGRGDGGFFELGLSAGYAQIARDSDDRDDIEDIFVGIALSGEYRWRGLFVEAADGSFDGVNLGYSFFQSKHWTLDLLAASVFGNIDDANDDIDFSTLNEEQRNDAILKRNTLHLGAGLRATAYLDKYILQFRVVQDVFEGNGVIATARAGRNWQYRNWNFHAVVGLEYGSADTVDYLFGITPEEATERFPVYRPGSAVQLTSEVGLTYPITQHWVYRSALRYTALPSEVTDSPLVDEDEDILFYNSITYVF